MELSGKILAGILIVVIILYILCIIAAIGHYNCAVKCGSSKLGRSVLPGSAESQELRSKLANSAPDSDELLAKSDPSGVEYSEMPQYSRTPPRFGISNTNSSSWFLPGDAFIGRDEDDTSVNSRLSSKGVKLPCRCRKGDCDEDTQTFSILYKDTLGLDISVSPSADDCVTTGNNGYVY